MPMEYGATHPALPAKPVHVYMYIKQVKEKYEFMNLLTQQKEKVGYHSVYQMCRVCHAIFF
jgi:hypothetical protein